VGVKAEIQIYREKEKQNAGNNPREDGNIIFAVGVDIAMRTEQRYWN
jgi:hypothetical protein